MITKALSNCEFLYKLWLIPKLYMNLKSVIPFSEIAKLITVEKCFSSIEMYFFELLHHQFQKIIKDNGDSNGI
jgi:hypothetical protein